MINSNNAGYNMNDVSYSGSVDNMSTTLFKNLIWLTTDEAAEFLRKSTHALRQMLYKGRVTARKVHGRLYFKKSELHELVDTSYF